MKDRKKKDSGKELNSYKSEYSQIKARILEIGFICRGSISKRRIACGAPDCACHKDPKKRHGPYYQLTWKEKGRTLSHYLSAEDVHLYQEWIQNRRTLMELIDELEAVSRKVGDCIRAAKSRKGSATKTRGRGKKSTNKAK